MRILFFNLLMILFVGCSGTRYIGGKPSYRYIKPNLTKMNEVEVLTVNEKGWTEKYLAEETQATRFTDDTIQRILKIQDDSRKWDILKRKYFYKFNNKLAGKVAIYQTATEGETLRLVSFKLYMDFVRAYDIQKLNPSIKKVDEPLKRGQLIYYTVPKISNVFQPSGIPIRAQEGEGLISLNYRITKDISQWVEFFKKNIIYLKNPNKVKTGDVLYYNTEWNYSSDPAGRTKIPEVIFSSSDVEYLFLMKANLLQSEGNLAGQQSEKFNEFR